MKKAYLTIIRKVDFIDLFKYGYINVGHAVEIKGEIDAHAEDEQLFQELTRWLGVYEYSFEYLILHFNAEKDKGNYILVDIKNVLGLYALDLEAKKEMGISFDSRIHLQVSPWAKKFIRLQQRRLIEQSKRGIDNLWVIFGLDEGLRSECAKIITEEVIEEVFRESYANERPIGALSIWIYLLRYERHSYYPKDTVGFFCDLIHVVCNYRAQKEQPDGVTEGTEVYHDIKEESTHTFRPLSEIARKSNLGKFARGEANAEFAVIAPLYLYLKDLLVKNKGGSPKEDVISFAKEHGSQECAIAVYLLGIVLGYDKTYDAFYDVAPLHILKKYVTQNGASLSSGVKKEARLHGSIESQSMAGYLGEGQPQDLFGNNLSNSMSPTETQSSPMGWVSKCLREGLSVEPVYHKEELKEKRKEGYKKIRKFTPERKAAIRERGFDPDAEEKRLVKQKIKK